MDIEKQIAYWRNGAKEDWDVAQELVQNGRTRHGLFFAHLALEKMLKALVCRQTSDLPPRIHNLVRLAELAALPLSQRQLDILAEMNASHIEGRYGDSPSSPSRAEAQAYMERAEEGIPVVDEAIVKAVKRYLRAVHASGIPVRCGVIFGSQATGRAHRWSDIDLLVVSPSFDGQRRRQDIDRLWHMTVITDSRIEPIAVGERQWLEDDANPLIEIARREGQIVTIA